MKKTSILFPFLFCVFLNSCSAENEKEIAAVPPPESIAKTYKYLALGDSYTIGESVCDSCRFPAKLKVRLEKNMSNTTVDVKIIARTGWTTTNLINAITTENPIPDYDLVTLLIGVNNQYQHKDFSLYETEFPRLVNKAIALAKGDRANVIVISIPDYAYTPYGQSMGNTATISAEIDQYNTFAQNYCTQNNIVFVNITDITREGLQHIDLITYDALHPSQLAYSRFADRILPKAINALSK